MKFSQIAVSCVFSALMALSGELLADEASKADAYLAAADEDETEDEDNEEFESNSQQRLEELRGWLEKRHQERGDATSGPAAIPEWTDSPERAHRSASRHGKRHYAAYRHKHSHHGYRRGHKHAAHKRHSGHSKAVHQSRSAKLHGHHPVYHGQARKTKARLASAHSHSAPKRSGKIRAYGKIARR